MTIEPAPLDAAGDATQLAASDAADRARLREQAGFAAEVGSGWDALSAALDDASDEAAALMASDFDIDPPIAAADRPFASRVMPDRIDRSPPASLASALAIVTAAITAGSALGSGATREASNSVTRTTTDGDDVATVTVTMKGTVTSTGSRVVAEFRFDIKGSVTNNVSGATADVIGTATARVELDGCPDASGSSKGKVSLSSTESVIGQEGGGGTIAGWTRDLSGDFEIKVNNEALTSSLTVDAQAQESVKSSTSEPGEGDETHEHELGVSAHWQYSSGSGTPGLAYDEAGSTGSVTHEDGATAADVAPLFKSAGFAIGASAALLASDAEKFWRDGKCVEVIVDPPGGDVDADSITDVVAKVRHRFEGDELDEPVEATLVGVKAIDPAGAEQPAPASITYTAGSADGDKGDVTFESVSNRGIGKLTVTFTVRPGVWTTSADTPLGEIRGTKCGEVGGEWIVEGLQDLGPLETTVRWTMTLDQDTLVGTYDHREVMTGQGTVTTSTSSGALTAVLNEDGSVTMTLDAAPVTIVTRNDFGGSGSATVPGLSRVFQWETEPGACPLS